MMPNDAPPADGVTEKSMRDALLTELEREAWDDEYGITSPVARLIARKLIDKALAGDVAAIREIHDRVDGKPFKATAGADRTPTKVIFEWNDSEDASAG
jgi:hypothetical protein